MLAADRRDHEAALAHFDVCQSLALASDDPHLAALSRVNYAEVLLLIGRGPEARRVVEDAKRILEGLESNFDAADVERVIALCELADGLLRQAESRLLRARELARQADARLIEAEVARDLARIYAESGRVEEAAAAFREAALTFAELGAAGDVAATERELAGLPGGSAGGTLQ